MADAKAKVSETGGQGETETGGLVRYSVREGVALLTLNDPPANTYSYEMMQELDRAVLAARMDEGVHVIVITGRGEKFFCAGANISMLTSVTPEFKYYFCLHANETLSRLEQTPKLVIAAVNGHCVGGGLEVALAADIRIARRGAGKMGLPEVTLGVLPGTGGTQRLVRVTGVERIALMGRASCSTSSVRARSASSTTSTMPRRTKPSWRRCSITRGSSPRRARLRAPSVASSAASRPARKFPSSPPSRSNANSSSSSSSPRTRAKVSTPTSGSANHNLKENKPLADNY